MLYNEKMIANTDLVVPANGCQFGNPVEDCPFTKYWDIKDPDDRINAIAILSNEELENLRAFHRKCVLEKVKQFHREPKFFWFETTLFYNRHNCHRIILLPKTRKRKLRDAIFPKLPTWEKLIENLIF